MFAELPAIMITMKLMPWVFNEDFVGLANQINKNSLEDVLNRFDYNNPDRTLYKTLF